MKPLRFVVIGIGGYAQIHIEAIKWLQEKGVGKLSGIVALQRDRQDYPEFFADLQKAGVIFFDTIDHFFASGVNSADVLTVPIGIHQHVPVSIRALEAGLDVYCEKPTAATVQEVDRLIQAEKRTGRKIVIGFQHIYSNSIKQLKKRICDDRLGAPKSISVLCGWPRPKEYFTRNDWAGRMRLGDDWILDSPANNACAHFLMNALYLASNRPNEAITPTSVQAELYRANHTESPDLVQIKLTSDQMNMNLLFSHCNNSMLGPIMKIVCENGQAEWSDAELGKTKIVYSNGVEESFDNGDSDLWQFDGFLDLVQAVLENRQPICTPTLTRNQTLVINAMHESCPKIKRIDDSFIEEFNDVDTHPTFMTGKFLCVKGLDDYLRKAFENDGMLSQLSIPWVTVKNQKKQIRKL